MKTRASGERGKRSWARRLARIGGITLLSIVGLVALVIATINLPWLRARVAREVSRLASEAIAGSVKITRIGHIGFGSVSGIDAELIDVSGRSALTLSDSSAQLDVPVLLRSLISDGPLTFAFEQIALSRLELQLRESPSGELNLLEALAPEPSTTQAKPAEPDSQAPRWRFESVTLEHATAQGRLGGLEDLEVSLQDLILSGDVGEEALRFDLHEVTASASGLPALNELRGELSGAVALRLDAEQGAPLPIDARAEWRGTARGLPVSARAQYRDEQLSGYLDIEAAPASLRRLWPDTALEDPLSLFIGFEGRLERLHVLAVLESRAGSLYVSGHVALSPSVSGRLSVLGLRLDAARWLSKLPESSVQLAAALRFELDANDGLSGQLALRTWSTTWAGWNTPELALSARWGADEAQATVRFELPGGRAVAEAMLSPLSPPGDEARRLDLRLEATLHDLARLTAGLGLGAALRGEARLEGAARIELRGLPSISGARLSATLRGFEAGSLAVRSGSIDIVPEGTLQNPRFGLTLDARGLSFPGYAVRRVALRGRGSLDELGIEGEIEPEAAAPARLRARLFPTERLARAVELVLDEPGPAPPLRFSAERLELDDGGLEVRNLEIQGPITGQLRLDGSLQGSRVRAQGSAVDFAPVILAQRLGLQLDVPRGVADLTFAIDYRPGHISGKLNGRVTRVCMGELRGGQLDAALDIDDNVVSGAASVRVPDLLRVELEASSLTLPARWEPSQLAGVTGELEVFATAELAELQTLARASWLSPASRGQIQARLQLTGVPGGSLPKLSVTLSTRELTWSTAGGAPRPDAPSRGPVVEQQSPIWQGVDLKLLADVDSSGIKASASIVDSRGELITAVEGSTELAMARLLKSPESFDPRELPIDISVEIPTRQLAAFPPPLRFEELDGSLNARLTATGSLGRPELAAELTLTELQLRGGRALPLAITADAKLEAARLELRAAVRNEQRQLLSLLAQAKLNGGGARPAIEQLELMLRSNGLPIESLGAALGLDVSGELFGSLHVQDLPARPSAQGTLWINDPTLSGFRQDQARWVIDAHPSSFSTQVEFRQAAGRARATASGPWQWSGELVPALEPRLTRFELDAKDFDIQGLRVFLPDQTRALSGRLDADVRVDSGQKRGLLGNLRLREGGIYIAALGQEFQDVQLDAKVESSGAVQIERLSGRTLGGRLSARGEADLDGLTFRSAHLAARIPKGDPLPLMFEGVTIADAWGRFDVDARLESGATQQTLDVDVTVPRLHVSLPEQSPHDVQELEEDPTIVTGTYLKSDRFLTLPIPPYEDEEPGSAPEGALPLVVGIEVQLGDEVWVERGTQLEVKLLGGVELMLKDELSARGEVRLARGTIDVQGRIFEIERGVITFVEERAPSNPTVVATARYTAPEGTEIYAEFVGPVETGSLSLRSEPPLRDDQILSLLLFGTPDGNFGTSTGGGNVVGGAALAAGGSVVTRGLNQELRRFTALDIQTRIGEKEGQPQPEVVVQISPRLTAELAYSVGTANPGRAEDRTYLTLNLRLFRNWSLSTTIGDAGSLLVDLLWRYRY